MPNARRWAWAVLPLLLHLAGGALLGYYLWTRTEPTAAAPEPAVYTELQPCPGCPPAVTLKSAEVQSRAGSTLFVFRGTWPSSLAGLSSDLRLVANDVDLVMHPDANGVLTLVRAKQGASTLPDHTVGAGLQPGAFLVDVRGAVLHAPVQFEFGLWDGARYVNRLPLAGQLSWAGGRAVAPVAGQTAPPRNPVTAVADPCTAVPTGTVAPQLEIASLLSGRTTDPRKNAARQTVAVRLATPMPAGGFRTLPPFSITVALSGPAGGLTTPKAGPVIDQAGAVQLWAVWDGTNLHKGVRRWDGGRWEMAVDAAADQLTLAVGQTDIVFWLDDIKPGWTMGSVAASATGCRATGLDAGFAPTTPVT